MYTYTSEGKWTVRESILLHTHTQIASVLSWQYGFFVLLVFRGVTRHSPSLQIMTRISTQKKAHSISICEPFGQTHSSIRCGQVPAGKDRNTRAQLKKVCQSDWTHLAAAALPSGYLESSWYLCDCGSSDTQFWHLYPYLHHEKEQMSTQKDLQPKTTDLKLWSSILCCFSLFYSLSHSEFFSI